MSPEGGGNIVDQSEDQLILSSHLRVPSPLEKDWEFLFLALKIWQHRPRICGAHLYGISLRNTDA